MRKRIVSAVLVLALIPACGGGGGGTSSAPPPVQQQIISGVAAAGWPLHGTVTIKDSRGSQKSAPIGVSGLYSIDVSSLAPPFVLKADGTVASNTYDIYSGATQTDINGNTNITPLTDLIISVMANEPAANYYSAGNFGNLTVFNLNNQAVRLQAIVQPLLLAAGVPGGSVDLLRTFFPTNNTGLDAVIGILSVSVNAPSNSATITNITTQQVVEVDFTTQTYTNSFTNTGGTNQAISDIQSLTNWFITFSLLFSTSLPSSTNLQLLSLFSEALFLNSGQNLTTFLTGLTNNGANIGLTFTGLTLLALNSAAGTAEVGFTASNGQTGTMFFVKNNGVWLGEGNQKPAQ